MSNSSDQNDRRNNSRILLNAKVKVSHEDTGESMYHTRDISDGGIFVVVGEQPFPPLGSTVEVQMQGLPIEAPVLEMVVVRKGLDGFGLRFAHLEPSDDT